MIIDGHNDVLSSLKYGPGLRHLKLGAPGAADGFAGAFFSVWVPSPDESHDFPSPPYVLPLAEPVGHDEARLAALDMVGLLSQLEIDGQLQVARSTGDFSAGHLTALLHLEGAEPVAADLSDLADWYKRGVRSVGIVWARRNAFGEGVPFAFPSSPDTGPGLTAAGLDLVRACNEMGIVVDTSHLNRRGFFDVADLSTRPLVATHSNVHALCPVSRNLEDDQLDAIRDSGGVVGVSFALPFLLSDGRCDKATLLEVVCSHLEYVAERAGAEHVAFGSDFEGADVPDAIGDFTGFGALVEKLKDRGWDSSALNLLTHDNWLRVLRDTWGETGTSVPAPSPGGCGRGSA